MVNGTVKGNLEGDNIIVSQDGVIQAETKVNNMTLGGTFEGRIRADQELIRNGDEITSPYDLNRGVPISWQMFSTLLISKEVKFQTLNSGNLVK